MRRGESEDGRIFREVSEELDKARWRHLFWPRVITCVVIVVLVAAAFATGMYFS